MEHIAKPTNAPQHSVRHRTKILCNRVNKYKGRGCTAAVLPVMLADTGAAFASLDETVPSSSAPVISLVQQYPLLTSAAAVVTLGGVAIAAALSNKAARSQPLGAKDAFEALKAEERTVLVDLRTKTFQKDEGLLNLKEANKKPVNLCYAKADHQGKLQVDSDFPLKLRQVAGIRQDSTLILIDSDGSLAPKAAAAAAADGYFSKVFWVRGGVEGPQGWKVSELPTKPYRALEVALPKLALPTIQLLDLPTIDLDALAVEVQAAAPEVEMNLSASVQRVGGAVNTIADKYKENPTLGNGVLAAASIAAVSAFAFTEFEAMLQIVGALGLARLMASNLLFAKDREATLAAFRAFLKEKGLDQLAGDLGSAASSTSTQLQQLATIVMDAPDAESAAQQITEQLAPDVRGADPEVLAAALVAAGVQLSGRMPSVDELREALADANAAPLIHPTTDSSTPDTFTAPGSPETTTDSNTPTSTLAFAVADVPELVEETVKASA